MTADPTPATPLQRMRARLARFTDWQIVAAYAAAARGFIAHPNCDGPDGDGHYELLKHLDYEITMNRPKTACCDDCSVPTQLGLHIEQLHDPMVAAAADVLLAATPTIKGAR